MTTDDLLTLDEWRAELEEARADRDVALAGVEMASTLVLSRDLVQRAFDVLNAGPGSAGIARALVLLREALGT